MDLTNLLNNSQLLKQLAKEFKQLKLLKTADMDYNAWMRQRLRELSLQQQHAPAPTLDLQSANPVMSGPVLLKAPPPEPWLPPAENLIPSRCAAMHYCQSQLCTSTHRCAHHIASASLCCRQDVDSKPKPAHPGSSAAAHPVSAMLQAASDRDRRLALSAALARQQVHLGIQGSQVAAAPEVVQAGTDHVLKLTQQLTQQQQDLLNMVQATQQQLQEQRELLSAVLSKPAAPSAPTPEAGAAVPAAAPTYTDTLHDRLRPAQCTPPAWFIPRASTTDDQEASQGQAAGEQVLSWQQRQQQQQQAGHQPGVGVQGSQASEDALQVLARCSPDGKLSTARQQRKQALKATLQRMLAGGGGPGGGGGGGGQVVGQQGARQSHVATAAGVRHPGTHKAGRSPQGGSSDVAVLRKVLRRLGWQQDEVAPTLPRTTHTAAAGGDSAATGSGSGSGGGADLPHEAWVPGGPSIADIESEAAAVLQRDRAAAERDRLARLEQLEAHLAAAVHQLHHQAQRLTHFTNTGGSGGSGGGSGWGGGGGGGVFDPLAATSHHPSLYCDPPLVSTLTSAGVLPHTAGDVSQGHLSACHTSSTTYHTCHSSMTAAESECVSHPSLALHRMLAQLQHLEQQEAALRCKWLSAPGGANVSVSGGGGGGGGGGGAAVLPPAGQPAAFTVTDAQVNTHLGQHTRPAAGGTAPAAQATSHPTHCTAATSDTCTVDGKEAVDATTVASVQEGRSRFLQYSSLVDGFLMGSAGSHVQPGQLVEDIADTLLDDVLQEQAAEMLQLCDTLGEHMLVQELQ